MNSSSSKQITKNILKGLKNIDKIQQDIKKQEKKNLRLFGKNIRNDKTFTNQTKVTKKQLKDYKNEKESIRYFYNKSTSDIVKLDIKTDNPKDLVDDANNNLLLSWGIKNVPKQKVIDGNSQIKNVLVLKNLDKLNNNNKIKVKIDINYQIPYPGIPANDDRADIQYRHQTKFFHGKKGDIASFLSDAISHYINAFSFLPVNNKKQLVLLHLQNKAHFKDVDDVRIMDPNIEITSELNENIKFDFRGLKLREEKPYNICNIYNNVIELKTNGNCVKDYMKKIYNNKISDKTINSLGNCFGVSPDELHQFCIKYKIKLILYNIEGNVIKANYPETKKKNYKAIIGIAYNNHFYPLESTYLKKVKSPQKVEIKKHIDFEFRKLIEQNIIPSNITYYNKLVTSFDHNNVRYIANTEYDTCKQILEAFGVSDKITPYTTLQNISDILIHLYSDNSTISSSLSFLPVDLNKNAFNYSNTKLNHKKLHKEYLGLDRNKAYSNDLYNLPYLIAVDYRTAIITKFTKNPADITDSYIYLVKPEIPSLLMENIEYYSGYHVKYCYDNGLRFTILEEITTTKVDNFYKKMIDDLYKKVNDHKIVKDIVNKMIGKMYVDVKFQQNQKVMSVCNNNEACQSDEIYERYNNELLFKLGYTETIKNVLNRKPVYMQIIDASKQQLHEKMNELKLTNDEIVDIATDAIFIVNKDGKYDYIKDEFNSNDWHAWKEIKKELHYFTSKVDKCIMPNENLSFSIEAHNNNHIFNCYAGAGKTHFILNTLIPQISQTGNTYIVLTPSHNASKTYIRNNINCKVIQTFNYLDEVPKEDHIIIDEIGLCNRQSNNFIYKCLSMDKQIYSFGDFRQLLPVMEQSHFNSKQYINHMYKNQHEVLTNYRNNFTTYYYDKLINDTLYIKKEVAKYMTDNYYSAEIVICKSNPQCDEYNKKIMKKLNIKFGDIGCKIICCTNKLRNKNIYNNFDFIIKDKKNDIITLDNNIEIKIEELNKFFKPAYAITIYKSQGQEYNSFYVPYETIESLTPREAYTIISRLKQKLTQQTISRNEKYSFKL